MEDYSVNQCVQACRDLTGQEEPLSQSDDAVVETVGRMVDAAMDSTDIEGTKKAIRLLNFVDENRSLDPSTRTKLLYFRSVAFSDLHQWEMRRSTSTTWYGESAEDEVIAIRATLQSEGFRRLPRARKCQIYTNLANTLRTIGRVPEAVEYYDRALWMNPQFAMARANRGITLIQYSDQLYDPGHQGVFLVHAHADLATALSQDAITDRLRSLSERWKEALEGRMEKRGVSLHDLQVNLHGHSMGETDPEKDYRQWCLDKRLFINPLNDLGAYPIASIDPLTTPTMVLPIDEGPTYQGAYNQLKQEYVSSRFLLYEGLSFHAPHFSDHGVKLYDTLDNPAYSLGIEKMKLAFRQFYSLMDKIAYIVSDYFDITKERNPNFRNVWIEGVQDGEPVFESQILPNREDNVPLKGLFWLCKDIAPQEVDMGEAYQKSLEPDARNLKDLRDALEHRYVKVVDGEGAEISGGPTGDRLANFITRDGLTGKALKLAKLVRNAIVLLSLAIHHEERSKAQDRGQVRTAKEKLDVYDHERKV